MHTSGMMQVLQASHYVPLVRDWWRQRLALGTQWPAEDICYGLAERFADIVIEDPAAFAAVRGRSCLYLANHQVGVESYLFSILVSGLSGTDAPVIAKAEHRATWIGRIVGHSVAYPGVADPALMVFVDRADPASVAQAFNDLAAQMRTSRRSVVVHVEGTRALACRQPVARLSPALLDMALAAGAPVVPVRFARGLPVEPSVARLEFPIGYCRQEYRIGRPILPEQLAAFAYKERCAAVLDALNGVGPALADELPAAPDAAFAARVADWIDRTGAAHEYAVIYTMLAERGENGDASGAISALLAGARAGRLDVGKDDASQWMGQLAQWLFGPRGPDVAGVKKMPVQP